MEEIISDSKFWILVAFIIFFGMLWKPLKRITNSAMEDRIDAIRRELEEASEIRREAEELLSTMEMNRKRFLKESKEIVKHAEQEATHMVEEAKQRLEEEYKQKVMLAKSRIETEQLMAMERIKAEAVDMAIEVAKQAVRTELSMNSALGEKIVEESLK